MDNIFNAKRVTANVFGQEVIIETGRMANQADGSVWIQCGGTVVLVTACHAPMEREVDFFPLTVEYAEKMYAAGRIPGSFFRREIGRPSERETLVSRLIDRPIRPLFTKGFRNEVQVLASVISADQINDPDTLAVTGASAALMLSSMPFEGPIAAARIGRVNGKLILNPTNAEQAESDLNLVFAASRNALVMVEGEADFASEQDIVDALNWGQSEIIPLLDAQEALAKQAAKQKVSVTAPQVCAELQTMVEGLARTELEAALLIPQKMPRYEARGAIRTKVMTALAETAKCKDEPAALAKCQLAAGEILSNLEKTIVRQRILKQGKRIDGRDTKTVRPIIIEAGLLPRAHGSTLFARGETKALVVATLGSSTDEQRMDSLNGDVHKRFMLHYNFPPFSVGEVRMPRVSRREIGHGALAEKALAPVLPSAENFPFTIRVVAETMESNGSSSMAAVCGGTLSLMDAGVPLAAPVAGVAMGLIKEGDEYIVLTDILGDEDALGDMDFKIAGTKDGITAVQMDIKISGIPSEVMARAMQQAKEARIHILGEMAKVLSNSRDKLSDYAPQHAEVMVNPDIIRLIIGPGGKNIKAITAATGASIDIDDSGKISIFAPDTDSLNTTRQMLEYYDQRPDLGKNYVGKVKKIMEIGAIVEVLPNVEALVHISQLDTERVAETGDIAKLGEDMEVKVIEINGDRIRASRKAVLLEAQGVEWDPADTARPAPRAGDRGDRGGRNDRYGGGRNDRGGDRGGDRGRGGYHDR